jgi:adenylosuccinate synthase
VLKTKDIIASFVRDQNRKGLQVGGDDLDEKTNFSWIADAVTKILQSNDSRVILVDAARKREQIDVFRRKFPDRHVLHVHLTAPSDVLRDRYYKRARQSDGISHEVAVGGSATEQNVHHLIPYADVVIDTGWSDSKSHINQIADRVGLHGSVDRLVDVLVGGQYGSEGKGNVAAYLAGEYDYLVRSGGPNAGHKVWEEPGPYCFHHLPSGSRCSRASVVLAPGAVFWVPGLMREINECRLDASRLYIDPQAMVIEQSDKEAESSTLVGKIGSTGQGVGSAVARRVLRNANGVETRLAKDIPELAPFMHTTASILEQAFQKGKRVFVEGTQGTGLSLYHGHYPYVTSRDTTVSGLLAEAGIPPARVNRVVMVCRRYPIRVQSPPRGTSGPMEKEITIEEVCGRSGIPVNEMQKTEMTSTTKRKRRIGEFEWGAFKRASLLNAPTDLAFTFADYISIENRKATCYEELTKDTRDFIGDMEQVAGVSCSLISTRFHPEGMIDRRVW